MLYVYLPPLPPPPSPSPSPPSPFKRILANFWDMCVAAISSCVLNKKRSRGVQARLHLALQMLREFFYAGGSGLTVQELHTQEYKVCTYTYIYTLRACIPSPNVSRTLILLVIVCSKGILWPVYSWYRLHSIWRPQTSSFTWYRCVHSARFTHVHVAIGYVCICLLAVLFSTAEATGRPGTGWSAH